MENPLVSSRSQPNDPDAALRPNTLAEFVGQAAALARPVKLEDKVSP